MQAVGKIGSYIGKGVHTVSGPFHPFGGAIDIIVVEQPDGTYKSSPWYVRFGKFQGVLKAKEKVVSISVNGVEADFHMYLDHKGEAFFLKEVDSEEVEMACSPLSSSDDSSTGSERIGAAAAVTRTNSRRAKLLGLVFGRKSRKEEVVEEDKNQAFVRTESLERAEIAADLLELKWSTNLASSRLRKDNSSQSSAVDIPKDKVSENFPADSCGCDEMGLISDESNQDPESTMEENVAEVKCSNSDGIAEAATSVGRMKEDTVSLHSETMACDKLGLTMSDFHVSSMTIVSEVSKCDSQLQESIEKLNSLSDTNFRKEEDGGDAVQSFCYSKVSEVGLVQCIEQRSGSFAHGGCDEASVYTEPLQSTTLKSEPVIALENVQEAVDAQECLRNEDQCSFLHEEMMSMSEGTTYATSEGIATECFSHSILVHQSNDSLKVVDSQCVASNSASGVLTCSSVEQQNVIGNQSDFGPIDAKHPEFNSALHEQKEPDSPVSSTVTDGTNECIEARCSVFSLDQSVIDDYMNAANPPRRMSNFTSNDGSINKTGHVQSKELVRMVRSLPNIGSVVYNHEANGLVHSSSTSPDPGAKKSTDNNHQSSGALTMAEDAKLLSESRNEPANRFLGKSPSSVDSFGGSRRGWPFSFKRSRTVRVAHMDMKGSENSSKVINPNNSHGLYEGNGEGKKLKNKIMKTLTPTSEQLASLSLKEGKNTVVFTFSTAMLGNQQVDARIFLWRWDTRIVISDVDGTITRSDLLGQVMPLVGMDWSQTGVAHLFSAIKENGYQLLFLSARSISQSFHTRRFLCKIRQDGKCLPDGPVVISPDGLFPSLYREVVRRTPHEFKISCLEDIKALFPPDRNPYYAGFGNRDTDEFSYLKVGIPRGKIFTINPKGEIVVNRHVHTKSYLSLHSIVHGMFPTMSSSEQEDYNSWNYWKLPPPAFDL